MPKKNTTMDQQSLQEEYEEIKFKLLMTRFAELEGKMLLEENEELSKDPFYLPSEKAKQAFMNQLNRHFTGIHIKQAVRRLVPIRYSKLVVVLPLFFVLLFITFFSVEAVRVKVLNLFIQVEREYTKIRFGEDSQLTELQQKIPWDNAYVPTKVPKGYSIKNVFGNQTIKTIEYKNEDEGFILFQQHNENIGMNVDTEEADEVIHTTIQEGDEGLVVQKRDIITVVWQNKTRFFQITGKSASLSKEELIEMAKSVKLLE